MIRYSDVPASPLPPEMASGTRIRWLIAGEDEAKAFYMRLFEVEPRGHIKPHHHPWEHEIFILEGSGEVRIGSRVYRVEGGYAVFIPPNVEHEYRAGGEGLKFICMIPAKPTAEETGKPAACE